MIDSSDPKSEFNRTYAVGTSGFFMRQYLTFHPLKLIVYLQHLRVIHLKLDFQNLLIQKWMQ